MHLWVTVKCSFCRVHFCRWRARAKNTFHPSRKHAPLTKHKTHFGCCTLYIFSRRHSQIQTYSKNRTHLSRNASVRSAFCLFSGERRIFRSDCGADFLIAMRCFGAHRKLHFAARSDRTKSAIGFDSNQARKRFDTDFSL